MSTCQTCHESTPTHGRLDLRGEDLLRSSSTGCPACQLLCDAVSSAANVSAADIKKIILYSSIAGGPPNCFAYLKPTRFEGEDDCIEQEPLCLELFVDEGAQCCWPAIGEARSIPAISKMDFCVDMAREWLAECRAHHSQTCWPGSGSRPSRLIRVGSTDAEIVLCVSSPETKGDYVALSHCWGQKQPLKTTTTNFRQHSRQSGTEVFLGRSRMPYRSQGRAVLLVSGSTPCAFFRTTVKIGLMSLLAWQMCMLPASSQSRLIPGTMGHMGCSLFR